MGCSSEMVGKAFWSDKSTSKLDKSLDDALLNNPLIMDGCIITWWSTLVIHPSREFFSLFWPTTDDSLTWMSLLEKTPRRSTLSSTTSSNRKFQLT